MNYLRLTGKLVASVILLVALFFTVALLFAFLPLYLALSMKGRGSPALLELVPLGILGGLLWRLWEPEQRAKQEELSRAFRDGYYRRESDDYVKSPRATAKKTTNQLDK